MTSTILTRTGQRLAAAAAITGFTIALAAGSAAISSAETPCSGPNVSDCQNADYCTQPDGTCAPCGGECLDGGCPVAGQPKPPAKSVPIVPRAPVPGMG
jgi:hypothetical protein